MNPSILPEDGRRDRTDDSGFVLPLLGLLLIPLVMFTAIAVDMSSWYSRATELQRTADAAALAGVIWTPQIDKARTEATPVLAKNGVVNGTDGMSVTMEYGQDGNTSFKVCVTETGVAQFFGAVFASPTNLTRCSTAQYNAPLQLGSPLNYFGGNHESLKTSNPIPTPADAYADPPPRSVFGTDRYCWVNEGGVTVGYWDRTSTGNNSPGAWRFYSYPANNLGGSHPVCGTTAPSVPLEPSAVACQVPGTDAYWYRDSSSGTYPTYWRYRVNPSFTTGTECVYGTVTDSPIPPEKSPNFWAAIESYNYGHANGDAYSNAGAEYRSTGYWYSVDVPDSGVANGTISIQAFDLGFNNPSGRSPTGDSGGDSNSVVRMRIFKAGPLKYDMGAIGSPLAGCDTGWITGVNNAEYNNSWKEICAIGSALPGERYYIQVQSTDEGGTGLTGRGVTGYSVRAVSGTISSACLGLLPAGDVNCYGAPGDVQPRLAAYGDMEMYNGINSGQPTQFFLADVLPTYAGKTLVVDLFDPGDGASTSWVTLRAPSSTTSQGQAVPSTNCDVEWRRYGQESWYPAPLSNGPDASYNDTCTVQTSGGSSTGACSTSSNRYNDCWLRFKVDLPSDYGPTGSQSWATCDPTVADPVNVAGSCWWQISYFVGSGTLGDYTTWSARVIGDPVRLTH